MVNYLALQSLADNLIKKFGGGAANGSLRRAGEDRPCSVVILQFTNREVAGSTLIESTDKRVYISAKDLDTPPDNELDTLILNGVEHKIVMPATQLDPSGETVVYWEIIARTLT